jgi:carboxylate-amine ligase
MIYFDVRPSAHVPTVELRIPDACPDVDDVVLLAGLFRALIRREREAVENGLVPPSIRTPVMRAAMWRAARSGLEGPLLDLPLSPAPVPAALAVTHLIDGLRPYLDEDGDTAQVLDLADRAVRRGSMAAVQRRALDRRGRLADVVDLLVARTRGQETGAAYSGAPVVALPHYARAGDEVFADAVPDRYTGIITALDSLGPVGLRRRETARDEEQRAGGVTFSVAGEASTRLFPVDLVPRVIDADEWSRLRQGLAQRALALDAFVRDVYGERAVVADGVLPAELVAAAPGLRPTGALVPRTARRVQVAGMDLVRDATGWRVLEDNLRVPSGIGYAIQNRRLGRAVLAELPTLPGLLAVDGVPALLRDTLASSSPVDDPTIVLLSAGTSDSAWFEHRMLAEEMGIPVVPSNELYVDDRTVYLQRAGSRSKVDVIYLRLDEDALLHAPGLDGMPLGPALLAAIYSGTVTIANALGNGIGDDKAIYAYVSRFVEYYLGEKPLLDQVPTYLCAVPDERDLVLSRLDSLVCKPVDGYGGDRVVIGPYARDEELDAVRRQILAAPHRWIAQEVVQLSTCPVFDGAELSPRHVDLRTFVFTGGDDTPVVAPAALTRVAPDGSMIVNSSRGGGSKDTWLLAHTPQ